MQGQTNFNNKKGQNQLNGLLPLVFVILTIGITLSVMASILVNVQSAQPNNQASLATGNESVAWVNGTGYKLQQANLVVGSESVWNFSTTGGPCCTLLKWNQSNSTNGNYSMDYNGGVLTILNVTPNNIISNTMNVSYQYFIGSASRNITGYGLTANTTFASYIPTITLVAVAAIIVGIIFAFFMLKKKEE